MKTKSTFCLIVVLIMLTAGTARADNTVTLKVSPENITIGTFYNGTTIAVGGEVPGDSLAVVRLRGEPERMELKKKDKVLGLLWMNLGHITLSGVPNVWFIYRPTGLDGPAIEKSIGFGGLRAGIKIDAGGLDPELIFQELLVMKKNERLYQEHPGEVRMGPEIAGHRSFNVDLQVPSRLSPGQYTIEALAIRAGQIVGREEKPLTARLEGAPAFMASLAFGHGALYGVLATIIAILGGLVIGQLFQSKGGAH